MRDRLLVKNEIEEREERFVGVHGHVIVWDVRWGATNAIELEFRNQKRVKVKSGVILPVVDTGSGIRQTESVLNV